MPWGLLEESNFIPSDLAYLAGFIDGDGSISAHNGDTATPRIDIYNTNEGILIYFAEKFGGRVIKVKPRLRKDGYTSKPAWHYYLIGQEVQELVGKLRPYLRLKTSCCDTTQ